MRDATYLKLRKIAGDTARYVRTGELLDAGLTNRQIGALVDEDYLSRVTFGIYWINHPDEAKPPMYRMIEVSLADPDAVICADSACFYHGIIEQEPQHISVVTRRTDRRRIEMDYVVNRFYISDDLYDIGLEEHATGYGPIKVYNAERSICDCYKYRNKLGHAVLETIGPACNAAYNKASGFERLNAYAKLMRVNLPKM